MRCVVRMVGMLVDRKLNVLYNQALWAILRLYTGTNRETQSKMASNLTKQKAPGTRLETQRHEHETAINFFR